MRARRDTTHRSSHRSRAKLAGLLSLALVGAWLPAVNAAPAAAASSDITSQASVTVSSENTSTGQTRAKAVDGAATGYPVDYTKEWATVGGKAGSWLTLTWPSAVTIDKVVLFDRPNTDDWITSANLVLSDGTKLATGSLNNNGTATTVSVPSLTTTSVRLDITGVAATTANVGLAEIQVFGGPAGNRPPIAKVPADFTAATGSLVTLDGSGSSDPDGDPLTYAWVQQGTPAVTLTGADTAKPTFSATQPGTYQFQLTVSDGKASSSASVTVTVQPNQPPTANAGDNQAVYTGTLVTLDGTKSADPESAKLTYRWAQVGTTPAQVQLSGTGSAKPTFTPTATGTYTFSLVVNDGQVDSAPAEVKVAVSDAPPVATNLAGKATVTASSQNTGTGQTAAKAIDGTADGYPGDYTKEWATSGGKAGSWLQLNWASPVTISKISLFDRPNLDDRVTSGTLQFSDGSSVSVGSLVNAGTETAITFTPRSVTWVKFTVTGVSATTSNVGLAEFQAWGFPAANRAPIADAGSNGTGLTGTTIALDGSRSSDPDGDQITYQWSQQANGASTVTIANPTAAKASFQPADPGNYAFTLTVSDGKLSSTSDVAVLVSPNRPPTANAGTDFAGLTRKVLTLDGSASSDPDGNGTLSYSWAQVGTSPAKVTLANPQSAKATFTTTTAGQYTFRLTVSDGPNSATDDVVVDVTLAPNTKPIANAGADQKAGPGDVVTLDGSASSDPDGDQLTFSWAASGTNPAAVTLKNPTTAKPTFSTDTKGTYTFTLTVNDGVDSATAQTVVTVDSAGTLTVANSGTSAVWTADFGSANANKSVQLQKQTIVTTTTKEVTTATWVTLKSATANSAGVATFTISDPLEVEHLYRAVINPTATTPLISDRVKYAAPRPTMSPATGLATVYIDTNEGNAITSTTFDWEGRMTITGATTAAGTTSTPCAAASNLLARVSGRGNYTWTLDKKPYKIKLDKKANFCGMGDGKKWALVANHYDRSLLRNTVAMKMSQGMSNLAFTPDSVPVDVFVNGSYQGSYTLMETATIGAGRVANGDNELKNNAGGVNDKAPNVTGTYLLEWDFRASGDHNVVVGGSGTVAIDEPGDEVDGSGITSAQIAYISKYLTDADDAVFANNFADPVNGWRKYIDEGALIDWYIVQELTKNLDSNLYTSVKMYKTRDTAAGPGKLFFGPVWDFDTSMGSADYPGNQGTTSGWYMRNENSAIQAKQTTETWINRLFKDPTFAANVKARWKQVYPTLQASDSFVGSQSGIISTSAAANFKKWDVKQRLEAEQEIRGSWSAEVSYLRSWLKDRIAWMNGQLGN